MIDQYGSVQMTKAVCPRCGKEALALGGVTACCDAASTTDPQGVSRKVGDIVPRGRPTIERQRQALAEQGHLCFWCLQPFGQLEWRKRRLVVLRPVWDHLSPYVYSQDNHDDNFVASCQVCNGIKHAKMFDSVEACRAYIRVRRDAPGQPDSEAERPLAPGIDPSYPHVRRVPYQRVSRLRKVRVLSGPPLACAACGSVIPATRAGQQYCSGRCRAAASRARRQSRMKTDLEELRRRIDVMLAGL